MTQHRANPADIEPVVIPGYEGRNAQLGTWNVSFEKTASGGPPHDLWKGLPDDHCQCPHLGYLLKGSFRVTTPAGEETIVSAGEAYVLEPGHLIEALEDIELVEFSPAEEFGHLMAHIEQNLASVLGS